MTFLSSIFALVCTSTVWSQKYFSIMEGISGKRALVTGGASGIGYGIAMKLCELGAKVYIIDCKEESLNEAVKDSGNKITSIQLDISDWKSTREAVTKILPIQLLVNNAGITILNSVLEATEKDFDTLMNINVKGMMNITQVITKDLIAREMSGSVVNLSSLSGTRTLKDHMAYSMSKAAVDMLTKTFAFELGHKNIRINAVCPTVVMTAMGKLVWSEPKKAKSMLDRIPMRRFAEVEDIVNPVIFLLSDNSAMINGHPLPIEGGYFTN